MAPCGAPGGLLWWCGAANKTQVMAGAGVGKGRCSLFKMTVKLGAGLCGELELERPHDPHPAGVA